jgi:hypothetical protein
VSQRASDAAAAARSAAFLLPGAATSMGGGEAGSVAGGGGLDSSGASVAGGDRASVAPSVFAGSVAAPPAEVYIPGQLLRSTSMRRAASLASLAAGSGVSAALAAHASFNFGAVGGVKAPEMLAAAAAASNSAASVAGGDAASVAGGSVVGSMFGGLRGSAAGAVHAAMEGMESVLLSRGRSFRSQGPFRGPTGGATAAFRAEDGGAGDAAAPGSGYGEGESAAAAASPHGPVVPPLALTSQGQPRASSRRSGGWRGPGGERPLEPLAEEAEGDEASPSRRKRGSQGSESTGPAAGEHRVAAPPSHVPGGKSPTVSAPGSEAVAGAARDAGSRRGSNASSAASTASGKVHLNRSGRRMVSLPPKLPLPASAMAIRGGSRLGGAPAAAADSGDAPLGSGRKSGRRGSLDSAGSGGRSARSREPAGSEAGGGWRGSASIRSGAAGSSASGGAGHAGERPPWAPPQIFRDPALQAQFPELQSPEQALAASAAGSPPHAPGQGPSPQDERRRKIAAGIAQARAESASKYPASWRTDVRDRAAQAAASLYHRHDTRRALRSARGGAEGDEEEAGVVEGDGDGVMGIAGEGAGAAHPHAVQEHGEGASAAAAPAAAAGLPQRVGSHLRLLPSTRSTRTLGGGGVLPSAGSFSVADAHARALLLGGASAGESLPGSPPKRTAYGASTLHALEVTKAASGAPAAKSLLKWTGSLRGMQAEDPTRDVAYMDALQRAARLGFSADEVAGKSLLQLQALVSAAAEAAAAAAAPLPTSTSSATSASTSFYHRQQLSGGSLPGAAEGGAVADEAVSGETAEDGRRPQLAAYGSFYRRAASAARAATGGASDAASVLTGRGEITGPVLLEGSVAAQTTSPRPRGGYASRTLHNIERVGGAGVGAAGAKAHLSWTSSLRDMSSAAAASPPASARGTPPGATTARSPADKGQQLRRAQSYMQPQLHHPSQQAGYVGNDPHSAHSGRMASSAQQYGLPSSASFHVGGDTVSMQQPWRQRRPRAEQAALEASPGPSVGAGPRTTAPTLVSAPVAVPEPAAAAHSAGPSHAHRPADATSAVEISAAVLPHATAELEPAAAPVRPHASEAPRSDLAAPAALPVPGPLEHAPEASGAAAGAASEAPLSVAVAHAAASEPHGEGAEDAGSAAETRAAASTAAVDVCSTGRQNSTAAAPVLPHTAGAHGTGGTPAAAAAAASPEGAPRSPASAVPRDGETVTSTGGHNSGDIAGRDLSSSLHPADSSTQGSTAAVSVTAGTDQTVRRTLDMDATTTFRAGAASGESAATGAGTEAATAPAAVAAAGAGTAAGAGSDGTHDHAQLVEGAGTGPASEVAAPRERKGRAVRTATGLGGVATSALDRIRARAGRRKSDDGGSAKDAAAAAAAIAAGVTEGADSAEAADNKSGVPAAAEGEPSA